MTINDYRFFSRVVLGSDIGFGWGGFAIEAVRRTGCRITGITISKYQNHLARERVHQAGLQDRIHILFRDYRKMNGHFDKIVSIEMLEAVGHTYYGTTLAQWQRRFKENQDQVTQLGFDRVFLRKWAYYLGSCEAGFRERVLGDLQLVLTREGNRRLTD